MIVYWSDEDQRYIVEVPELPGCMADGETPEEAVRNAQVIIREWIETAQALGREVPQPRRRTAAA
jgi:predicted RNase H-like HicB family nuclease